MTLAAAQHAPAFTLPDENGQLVRFPGLRRLLLVFYRGDW
jgi:peroxiredoxin